jgi:hypothetical protein
MSTGQCVLALLANTVPARERPAEVLAVLARATGSARGLRSERGAAGRTARALIALARPSGMRERGTAERVAGTRARPARVRRD